MLGVHRITIAAIAVSALWAIPGMPLIPYAAAQSTPIETLEQQRTAVLNAKSVDDLSDFLPEQAKNALAKMTPAQKQAALAELKKSVKEKPTYTQRVNGKRAAVMIEEPGSKSGVKIELMDLERGKWVTQGEQQIMLAVPRARASFTVHGAAGASADEVEISQTRINGRPVVVVADELLDALNDDRDVPRVTLAIDECLSPGPVDLGVRDVDGVKVGSQVSLPGTDGAAWSFQTDPKGTLTVKRVKDGRFDGTFHLTLENEKGDTVVVAGSLMHAQDPCDQ